MGNCLRSNEDNIEIAHTSHRVEADRQAQPVPPPQPQHPQQHDQQQSVGKNQPLRREPVRWIAEPLLTPDQLCAKRDEFWDTAPAFDGRREVWDALRAAARALEADDHALAQAIVSGAGITLPRGLLTDCYDELGTRYQLPLYVLAPPDNLLPPADAAAAGAASGGDDADAGERPVVGDRGGGGGGGGEDAGDVSDGDGKVDPSATVQLRLRLSTGREVMLLTRPDDPVLRAKRRLERQTGCPAGEQRWYCYGGMLPDRALIRDCVIPRGFVVQVVLRPPREPPPVTD